MILPDQHQLYRLQLLSHKTVEGSADIELERQPNWRHSNHTRNRSTALRLCRAEADSCKVCNDPCFAHNNVHICICVFPSTTRTYIFCPPNSADSDFLTFPCQSTAYSALPRTRRTRGRYPLRPFGMNICHTPPRSLLRAQQPQLAAQDKSWRWLPPEDSHLHSIGFVGTGPAKAAVCILAERRPLPKIEMLFSTESKTNNLYAVRRPTRH